MTGEYEHNRNNEGGDVLRDNSHDLLQRINAKIGEKQNEPQELWASLRFFMVADKAFAPPGLARDVIDFCLAVYDTLEPNAPFDERQKRIAHAEALALSLNPRIGGVVVGLSAKDNAFLVKWGVLTGASMVVLRQQDDTLFMASLAVEALAAELRQVDHGEMVISMWLYSLYSAIFALAHGRIPAGVLGLASFGIGLAMANGEK